MDIIESVSPNNAPIITKGQQQFRWSKKDRLIAQLFHYIMYLKDCFSTNTIL